MKTCDRLREALAQIQEIVRDGERWDAGLRTEVDAVAEEALRAAVNPNGGRW